MTTIRKLERNHIQIQTELGTIEIKTSLSDQSLIHIQTELGTITIRLGIIDAQGKMEAFEILANQNARQEGSTMVTLRPR